MGRHCIKSTQRRAHVALRRRRGPRALEGHAAAGAIMGSQGPATSPGTRSGQQPYGPGKRAV
eukprot:2000199-Alexandrium_andersonii.AAC.2